MPLVVIGVLLLAGGWIGRRRLQRPPPDWGTFMIGAGPAAALWDWSVWACWCSRRSATALPAQAGGDTDPTALVGEGGSFLTPVTDVLLKADSGLAPLNPSYNDANLDNAIGDFVGTAPGSFDADFVVSERPLTSAEAATAKANGRTFAYVPFAATPVAVATLADCNPAAPVRNSTAALCQDIPLTVPLVAPFTSGLTSPRSPNRDCQTGWADPRLTQPNGQPIPNSGSTGIDPRTIGREHRADGPARQRPGLRRSCSTTPSTTREPSHHDERHAVGDWPFHGIHAFVGGDAGLIGKELNINAETNAPSVQRPARGALGRRRFPVSSVWTGAPQGTPWNIPTAAIQNAAGKFVPPSEPAAGRARRTPPWTQRRTWSPSCQPQ